VNLVDLIVKVNVIGDQSRHLDPHRDMDSNNKCCHWVHSHQLAILIFLPLFNQDSFLLKNQRIVGINLTDDAADELS
jgi:hypothetical protein